MEHVLITGGSRGIGAACVRAFSQAGYAVSFFYHTSEDAAKALARECGAQAICCDVADAQGVAEAVSSIAPVQVLVNNAGIAHYGLISQISQADWRRLFAVNVDGVYHCINAVLPAMLRRRSGSIVNVSSIWGHRGASCEAAYSATKGAVLALTKALAQELAPSNIRVNSVSPGVILTDMTANVEDLDALAAQTPLGRNGSAEEVAQGILFLAQAPFITGQDLLIDGGFTL
ncbi:MAG: SDR family oxidoreductase [Oscillospiraceae bacterium]|jgi:3-oxoacyl-[acyl-carrier protein] reductase|nr:SDR family oxidoreductase [Oscillospiraceae bacterium]